MTSPAFEGEAVFEYEEDGLLRRLELPEFGVAQHSFLLAHLPGTLVEMRQFQALLKDLKSPAKINELKSKICFEDFWKRYFAGRGVDNSSKKKARTRWDRMSESSQAKAYEHIPKYLNKIPQGVGVKLAETYLNSEIWD
jgi:hypothetical protein